MVNDKPKKGFAGLDSMISEVGPAPEPSEQPNQEEPTEPANRQQPNATSTDAEPSQVFTGSPEAGSGAGISGKGWLLIAIGVLVLLAWLANSGNRSSSQPAVPYEPPAPTTNNAATFGGPAPSAAVSSTENEETIPPVGSGLTLDRSQIRYCLSQRIRMEAWKGQLNENPQTSADAFNASVDFYNARCSNYRYRTGDLESVRTEVQLNRAALTQQGLSMAASANASVPVQQNTPAIKTSFDCAKARSDAERLICNDAELAAADVDLAKLFAQAKAAATDQDAFKERARVQWNYRESSCHDRDCLVQWYANQRQWLTGIVSNPNVPAQPDGSAQSNGPAPSQSSANAVGNCTSTVTCAKAMLMFASSENLAGAMQAARTIDSLPKPPRGDRATARKLNQDALAALNASRPSDAVRLLEQASQADPGDEEVLSNLSFAYSMDGQLAKSEDTAVVALALNPRRTNVWAPLAVTLAKENRMDQATEAMWLAYQFSADKQRTLTFIDSRLAVETDPAVVKMYSSSKAWLTENIKPKF
ncbi:hypothetical protein [Paraburkholderia youngii]|uniref:hypothetical protein n=1 Tax=Paraburkholderia youngii TaxID=2782701 RepID=UPI001595B3B1|nr:hypothetical protein [Paraburkholderia youngii]